MTSALDKQMHAKLPVAVHIFLLRDEKVLLLRRQNTGYEDGNYGVPAGHLDGNETVIEAAIREVREEVGVSIDAEHLKVVGIMHRLSQEERIDFFCAVTAWFGTPTNREPGKCDQLLWSSVNTLPQNTIPYIRKALENTAQNMWFEEFGSP